MALWRHGGATIIVGSWSQGRIRLYRSLGRVFDVMQLRFDCRDLGGVL